MVTWKTLTDWPCTTVCRVNASRIPQVINKFDGPFFGRAESIDGTQRHQRITEIVRIVRRQIQSKIRNGECRKIQEKQVERERIDGTFTLGIRVDRNRQSVHP